MEFKNYRLFFFTFWGSAEWIFLYGAIWLVWLVGTSRADSYFLVFALIFALGAIFLLIPLILSLVGWPDPNKRPLGQRQEDLSPLRTRLGLGLLLTLNIGWLAFTIWTNAAFATQVTPFWRWEVVAKLAGPSGSVIILAAGLVLSFRTK